MREKRTKLTRDDEDTEQAKFVNDSDDCDDVVFAVSTRRINDDWYLDSGATRHMTNKKNFYKHIVPNKKDKSYNGKRCVSIKRRKRRWYSQL